MPPSITPQAPTLVRQDHSLVIDTSSLVPRFSPFSTLLKGGTCSFERASTLATDLNFDHRDADPGCRWMPLQRIVTALRL